MNYQPWSLYLKVCLCGKHSYYLLCFFLQPYFKLSLILITCFSRPGSSGQYSCPHLPTYWHLASLPQPGVPCRVFPRGRTGTWCSCLPPLVCTQFLALQATLESQPSWTDQGAPGGKLVSAFSWFIALLSMPQPHSSAFLLAGHSGSLSFVTFNPVTSAENLMGSILHFLASIHNEGLPLQACRGYGGLLPDMSHPTGDWSISLARGLVRSGLVAQSWPRRCEGRSTRGFWGILTCSLKRRSQSSLFFLWTSVCLNVSSGMAKHIISSRESSISIRLM